MFFFLRFFSMMTSIGIMSEILSPYFAASDAEGSQKEDKENPPSCSRLVGDFYNQDASRLARALLGKILVRRLNKDELICGRIVETEAYLGVEDKACHSFGHRRTARTKPMFMKPGTIYVYSIYGMYHCMNVSSFGDGAAVLLRAIEPLLGLDQMRDLRHRNQRTQRPFHPHQLCNGPSKICLSYSIGKELNEIDLSSSSSPIWIEDWNSQAEFQIVTSSRIGLGKKAEEWASAPLRFYVLGSTSVSVTDLSAKKRMSSKHVNHPRSAKREC